MLGVYLFGEVHVFVGVHVPEWKALAGFGSVRDVVCFGRRYELESVLVGGPESGPATLDPDHKSA